MENGFVIVYGRNEDGKSRLFLKSSFESEERIPLDIGENVRGDRAGRLELSGCPDTLTETHEGLKKQLKAGTAPAWINEKGLADQKRKIGFVRKHPTQINLVLRKMLTK